MVIVLVLTVRGGGDRASDDFCLDHQALDAGVDQPVAELRQVENAGDQRDQAGEIERDDAAGQAGEGQRDEEAPDAGSASSAVAATAALQALYGGSVFRRRGRRSVVGVQVSIRLRTIKQWRKLPVVSWRVATSLARYPTPGARPRPSTTRALGNVCQIRFP